MVKYRNNISSSWYWPCVHKSVDNTWCWMEFIYSHLNVLFSKTGSFISNFVFLEIVGPQCWCEPHNAVCDCPSPARQDQYAQTTPAGCCNKRSGVRFIQNKIASPAAPQTPSEFWTLPSWIAALCVSHAVAKHLDPTNKHLKCIHQGCKATHVGGGAGRGRRAALWCAKLSRLFF